MTRTKKKKASQPCQAKDQHKKDARNAATPIVQAVNATQAKSQFRLQSATSNIQPVKSKNLPYPLLPFIEWVNQLSTPLHQLASATKFFSRPGNENSNGYLPPFKVHESLVLAVTMLQDLSHKTGQKLRYAAMDVQSLRLMSAKSLVKHMVKIMPLGMEPGMSIYQVVTGTGIELDRNILHAAAKHIRELQGRAPSNLPPSLKKKEVQTGPCQKSIAEKQNLPFKSEQSDVPETYVPSFPVRGIIKDEDRSISPARYFPPLALSATKREHASLMTTTKLENDLAASQGFEGSYEQQRKSLSEPKKRHSNNTQLKTQSEHEVEQALLKIDKWATAWLEGKLNHNPADLNIPYQPKINTQRMESAEAYHKVEEFTSKEGFNGDTYGSDVFRDEWNSMQYCLSIPDIEILEEGEVSNEDYNRNDDRNKMNLTAGHEGPHNSARNWSEFPQKSTCRAIW